MYNVKSYYCIIFAIFQTGTLMCMALHWTQPLSARRSLPKNCESSTAKQNPKVATSTTKTPPKNIRSAINRHMQDLGRAIDVIRGVEFRSANRVLDGMLKQMTKQGQSRPTQHKPVLESEDLVKIATYFQKAMLSQVMLRHRVWYYISIHFVSRGLEFHHQLKRDSLIFQTDDKGDEYVTLSHECQQKNCQDGLNSEEAAADKRMYATGRDDCPVQMLRHFIQRTDDEATHLFNSCTHEALASPSFMAKWYGSKPLNKRTFTRFMPDISKYAGCSMKYTVHCFRAAAIQVMNDAGYESRHIMFMSGHRNEGSLRSYSRHMSTTQKIKRYCSVVRFPQSHLDPRPLLKVVTPT